MSAIPPIPGLGLSPKLPFLIRSSNILMRPLFFGPLLVSRVDPTLKTPRHKILGQTLVIRFMIAFNRWILYHSRRIIRVRRNTKDRGCVVGPILVLLTFQCRTRRLMFHISLVESMLRPRFVILVVIILTGLPFVSVVLSPRKRKIKLVFSANLGYNRLDPG